jgi:phage/plasmid-like protein (TIGR03299 family)
MRENIITELLNSTELNWTVSKQPLQTAAGLLTQSYGIFRGDNHKWLGTVGKQYQPFQNYDLAATLIDASQGVGIEFNRGGLLKEGGKVYLQAELPAEYIGKSDVKRWITALNSHDGTSSIGFGSCSTVVVCQNTFYRAYREIQKFRHTTTAKNRIEAAIADMRSTLALDNKLMEDFKRMADKKLNDELTEKVLQSCFDLQPEKKLRDYSTRKIKILDDVRAAIEREVELEGKTIWGLFNGITRYTNHIATPAHEKTDYIMSGSGYKTNLTAYNEIMEWVSANTRSYSMASN